MPSRKADRRYFTNAQRRAYGWPLVGRPRKKRSRAK
jgi:hypothetical protein